MNLDEKLARSRSTERIDFSKYQSVGENDPLVEIATNEKIFVEPCWTLEDDWEGKRYRDYIVEHPVYDTVYVRSELATRLQTCCKCT